MRKPQATVYLLVLFGFTSKFCAAQDSKAAIQQKLESEYSLTQPTGDQTDIVTAGSVLVLLRGKGSNSIMMAPSTGTDFYQNVYKDGKISQGTLGQAQKVRKWMSKLPGGDPAAAAPNTRTFVPGEKMWVTKIDVKDDGIVFDLFTDAYADVRYKAALRFAYPKSSSLTAPEADKLVSEVFKVQPSDDAKEGGAQQPAQGQVAASGGQGQSSATTQPVKQSAEAPPAPIAPPPPPTDAPAAPPKSLSKGQKTDEVVANFGPPEKVIKLGSKQIYVYKDMKVTFVDGKVSDVQ